MAEAATESSRALKTGVVMDPISGIKTYKDSSFAMLLEAQRRGHVLYYMEPNDMYAVDGRVFARMQKLEVRDNTSDWFTLTPLGSQSLDELDIVLMRRDPPFDMDYIYATYMLELAETASYGAIATRLRPLNIMIRLLLFIAIIFQMIMLLLQMLINT